MSQWRLAGDALAAQRVAELQAMTDDAALAAAEAVLELAALAPLSAERLSFSRLVLQQALFLRQRSA